MSPRQKPDTRCRESLDHDEKNTIVALAPHGGAIESYTGKQAHHIAEKFENCSSWVFEGYDKSSARDVFWETSTNIDPNEYRLLGDINDHGFEFAISFHGYTKEGVYVGGGINPELREYIAWRISEVVDVSAKPAKVGDGLWQSYGGTHYLNIVNRVPVRAGIQIEQSYDVRESNWKEIAQVVGECVVALEAASIA